MRIVEVTLKSISPYSQSRKYEDPKLTRKSGSDAETPKQYEARTWRERLHTTEDGHVFIPPMAFKNCLTEAAKFAPTQIKGQGKATYTKSFEAGVMVTDMLKLPVKKADVPGEWLFVPSDGRRGGGKRVEKCFPVIQSWNGKVQFVILDDSIPAEVFERTLRDAGTFIGIGRFRPRNNGYYGRFEVQKVSWQ